MQKWVSLGQNVYKCIDGKLRYNGEYYLLSSLYLKSFWTTINRNSILTLLSYLRSKMTCKNSSLRLWGGDIYWSTWLRQSVGMPVIGLIMISAVCSECKESEHFDIFWPVGAKALKIFICRAKRRTCCDWGAMLTFKVLCNFVLIIHNQLSLNKYRNHI
jgi:hypothetical protein